MNHSTNMTTQPTPNEVKKLLERLKELHEKATPGTWHGYSLYSILRFARKNSGPWEDCPEGQDYPSEESSDWMVEMHNAFPTLLSLASQSLTATQRADVLAEELGVVKSQREELEFQSNGYRTSWEEAKQAAITAGNQLTAAQEREERMRVAILNFMAESNVGTLSDGDGKREFMCPECTRDAKTGKHEEGCVFEEFQAIVDGDAPPSDARKTGWLPIETAPRGKKLIAGYWNQLGNWRTVIARYYLPMTLPSTDDWASEPECNFMPEGWYEESETHEEIYKVECPPVLWMSLPPSPTPSTEGKGGES